MFAHRGDAGTRLDVDRGARPIPEAGEAHQLGDDEDAWRSDVGGSP
ncbi:MAG TPA: hypothetical protein VFW65_29850 [Pseudonocardiaceae bacterium]|nr:hypothetical protein [Pseudonocardiaceae bacterium]